MGYEIHKFQDGDETIYLHRHDHDEPLIIIDDPDQHADTINSLEAYLTDSKERNEVRVSNRLQAFEHLIDVGEFTEAKPDFVECVRDAVRSEGIKVDDSYRYLFAEDPSGLYEKIFGPLPPERANFSGKANIDYKIILISTKENPSLSDSNNYHQVVYIACHETVHGREKFPRPARLEFGANGEIVDIVSSRNGFVDYDNDRGLLVNLLEEACATRFGKYATITALRSMGIEPEVCDDFFLGRPFLDVDFTPVKGVFALQGNDGPRHRVLGNHSYAKAAIGLDLLCHESPEFADQLMVCLNENTKQNVDELAVIAEDTIPGVSNLLVNGNIDEDAVPFATTVLAQLDYAASRNYLSIYP